MRNLIQQRPILTFFILAFAIGFLATALRVHNPGLVLEFLQHVKDTRTAPNIITGVPFALENPLFWTFYLFPAAPTIAALIIIGLGWGKAGYIDLLDRLRPWRDGVSARQGITVYLMIMAVFLSMAGFVFVKVGLEDSPEALQHVLDRYGGQAVSIYAMLLVSPLLGPGGLLEEIGWRGYALPILLKRYSSPLTASVVLGLIWGAWHFPRDFAILWEGGAAFEQMFGDYTGYILNRAWWFFGVIMSTIIITYVYNLTGGSVLSAIVVHNIGNELSVGLTLFTAAHFEFLSFQVSIQDVLSIGTAIIILLVAGPNLGKGVRWFATDQPNKPAG